ncbi:MAG: HEAT repeat domain-containing protein [Thermoguttaceae bacterium]|jgi:HEAT repeat protein
MWKNKLNVALAAALWFAGTAFAADEAQLIAVLKSHATRKEKADACRELARVGTKQAVPALAALLGDEKLSHMARYGLEPISDPSVDAALRDAMGRLKGRPLLGVIGSLGVRRDAKAVDSLAKLLADADDDIAQAAARALGKIGTPAAAKALDDALAGAPAANQVAFCEGLFRSAEALSAKGQRAQSLAIYDRLRGLSQAPQQVRAGALRGAILARGKEGIPLMIEAIRGTDYVLTAAAARTAMELPGPEVTAALAGELPKLPADKQVLLVNTLGYRGDASAGPALLALASKGPVPVRLAAIRNLTHLGHAPALTLLAELALTGEAELATAARECLGNFPGRDAEATIAAMLAHKDAKVRCLAIEMIAQRKAAEAAASLFKAAADDDQAVRVAALKALRDQVGLAELPALLGLLVKARSSAELQAAENALRALCARQSGPAGGNLVVIKAEYGNLPDGPAADVTKQVAALVKGGALAVEASNDNFGDPASGVPKKLRVDYAVNGVRASKTVAEQETLAFTATSTPPAIVDAICAALGGAQGEAKLALLRSLRSAGGPKALQTVKAAAADNDAQVKDTALHALCDWPTPDALPLVADLVKTPPTKTIKILAFRGFVRLVPQQEAPDAKKLDWLKDAMALADRDEEKRLVLSALGNVPTANALAVVASHLDNPVLREEACLAAVAIAEKLAPSQDAAVTAAMKQVTKLTANKKLAARARAIARQAKP